MVLNGKLSLGEIIDELNKYDSGMDFHLCREYLPNVPQWLGLDGLELDRENLNFCFIKDNSASFNRTEFKTGIIRWNLKHMIQEDEQKYRDYSVVYIDKSSREQEIKHAKKVVGKNKRNRDGILINVNNSSLEFIDLVLLEFEK